MRRPRRLFDDEPLGSVDEEDDREGIESRDGLCGTRAMMASAAKAIPDLLGDRRGDPTRCDHADVVA